MKQLKIQSEIDLHTYCIIVFAITGRTFVFALLAVLNFEFIHHITG